MSDDVQNQEALVTIGGKIMRASREIIVAVAVLSSGSAAARTSTQRQDNQVAQHMCLSVSCDKSGSFSKSECLPDSLWFDHIIDAASQPISHLGFQVIVDNADRRFIRHTFDRGEIDLTGLQLSERLVAKLKNDSVLEEYARQKGVVISECLAALKSTPISTATDLSSAVERSASLHGEPPFEGWKNVAVFISDCENTARAGPRREPRALILVAGATYEAAQKLFKAPVIFESHLGIEEFLRSAPDNPDMRQPVVQVNGTH